MIDCSFESLRHSKYVDSASSLNSHSSVRSCVFTGHNLQSHAGMSSSSKDVYDRSAVETDELIHQGDLVSPVSKVSLEAVSRQSFRNNDSA